MNFTEIVHARQSCRSYDTARPVETEKITAILESARLAPSASNAQEYHFTVCTGESAKAIAAAADYKGLNKFAHEAPVHIVISEKPYNKSAALGVKLMGTDYPLTLVTCTIGGRTRVTARCVLTGEIPVVPGE